MPQIQTKNLTKQLLTWFNAQRRELPWRDAPCGQRDGYRVWLSEVMLQQTTVTAVIPYYLKFLDKWPDVKALAKATDDDVMRAWAGLGYYARARNMLKCARFVSDECQGVFPRAEEDLVKLPGVGPYTAAAICSIGFNGPSAPVDGNVIRTLSRLYAVKAEMPKNKDQIQVLTDALLPKGHSGDYAEALMDLGSLVCKPKNPNCADCPWVKTCKAFAAGKALAYPVKAPKKVKPTRRGWAFWIENTDGHILLERRPPKGLLGGMMGLPGTEWTETLPTAEQASQVLSVKSSQALPDYIKHTFTHFHLELGVIFMKVEGCEDLAGEWIRPEDLDEQALPSVMRKAIAHARQHRPSQHFP